MLSLVYGSDKISKADIVRRSSFSQTHVYLLLDALVERGYLEFGRGAIRGKGKPSPNVAINSNSLASIGLSFTSDTVKLALLNLSGECLLDTELVVPSNEPHEVLKSFKERIDTIRRDYPERRLIGMGVAMQGFRTGEPDVFRTPQALAAWRSLPIRSFFAHEFDCTVIAENNATSAAIAEQLIGAGHNARCLAYLSFNFGFGAGFLWNDKAVFGGHGNAGEITHMFLPEEIHHRPALGELQKRLGERGIELDGLQDLAKRFDPTWPGVEEWIQEITPSMKLTIRAIKAIIDPTAIFFGGEAPDALRRMLIDAADISDLAYETPDPQLLPSGIVGDSAHMGAALLPIHQLLLGG
ncbi:ROK family protein [uncultured Roseobacter sp.]|uniref:ROK family protein n=1 Tax=uncultured Roseobacter sp. TaxID=114847 RepID=UPI0026049D45|nr:ROK family protein [uncultured Roseobacter sp.]